MPWNLEKVCSLSFIPAITFQSLDNHFPFYRFK